MGERGGEEEDEYDELLGGEAWDYEYDFYVSWAFVFWWGMWGGKDMRGSG